MITNTNRVSTRFFASAFALAAFLFISVAQVQATVVPTPTVTPEEFIAVDGSYKGVSVGFRTEGFGTVTSVSVTVTRDDASTVTKTANQGVIDIINNDTVGGDQLTTPFVIEEGTFTEAGDLTYWNPAPAAWDTDTRPVSVEISVTDENGTVSVSNSTFNDGAPSWPTYESLLTSAIPGYASTWFVDANNSGSEDGSEQHPYNTLDEAIAAAGTSELIEIQSDLHTTATVLVNKSITIDGNGFTLFPEFTFTSNSNNTGLLINADNITLRDIIVDGIGGTNLHGIHVYVATGVTLENVTVGNNDKSGITVNGSTVTFTDSSTAYNGWGGINVDQGSGVVTPATLTVTGTSFHSESGPFIWIDDVTKPLVSISDTEGQYVSTMTGNTRLYVLAVVPVFDEEDLTLALNNTLINDTVGSHIEFGDNIEVGATVSIARPDVTVDGADFTLSASGSVTGHVVLITAANTTLKNLVEDGNGHNIHGLQSYRTTNSNFENVTVQNNGKSGITVNGSTVTVTNITTLNNGWGGINVDQGSGVTDVTTLTVNGISAHTETHAAIWRDDNAKTDVTVVDTNNQYDAVLYVHDITITGTEYFLKAPVVPVPPTNNNGGGHSHKKKTPAGEVLGAATTTATTSASIPVVYYNFMVDFGIGTENLDVTNLQIILINAGYLKIDAPTGYFGPLTLAAVQQYQAAHGINTTGFVGPLTRAQLNTTPVTPLLSEAVKQKIKGILLQIALLQAQLDAMKAN